MKPSSTRGVGKPRVTGGPVYPGKFRKAKKQKDVPVHLQTNGSPLPETGDEDEDRQFSELGDESPCEAEQANWIAPDIAFTRLQVQMKESQACVRRLCNELCEDRPEWRVKCPSNPDSDLFADILGLANLCRFMKFENVALRKEMADLEKQFRERTKGFEEREAMFKDGIQGCLIDRQSMSFNNAMDNRQIRDDNSRLKSEIKKLESTNELLRIENCTCLDKLQKMEEQLLDAPRIEEAFIKNMKSDLRQKDYALSRRELYIKRKENEAKDRMIWKEKANSLEVTIQLMQRQFEEAQRQSRIQMSKLQRAYSELKRHGATSAFDDVKGAASDRTNNGIRPSSPMGNRRPASAPMGSKKPVHKLGEAEIDNLDVKVVKTKLARTLTERNLLEQRVVSLSHKLSNARAFPLFNLGRDESNDAKVTVGPLELVGQELAAEQVRGVVEGESKSVLEKKEHNTTLGLHLSLEYAEAMKLAAKSGEKHAAGTLPKDVRLAGLEEYSIELTNDDSDTWSASYLEEEQNLLAERQRRKESLSAQFRNRIHCARSSGPVEFQEVRRNVKISGD